MKDWSHKLGTYTSLTKGVYRNNFTLGHPTWESAHANLWQCFLTFGSGSDIFGADGFEDITPQNSTEYVVACCCMRLWCRGCLNSRSLWGVFEVLWPEWLCFWQTFASLHFQLTAPHLHPCGVIRGLWVYHAFDGFGAPDNCKYSPNSPRDSIIMSSHVQPMIMSARAQAQVCVLLRKHLVSVSVKSLLLNLPLKHVWTDFEQWLNHCFHVFNVSTSFNYQLTSTNISCQPQMI